MIGIRRSSSLVCCVLFGVLLGDCGLLRLGVVSLFGACVGVGWLYDVC